MSTFIASSTRNTSLKSCKPSQSEHQLFKIIAQSRTPNANFGKHYLSVNWERFLLPKNKRRFPPRYHQTTPAPVETKNGQWGWAHIVSELRTQLLPIKRPCHRLKISAVWYHAVFKFSPQPPKVLDISRPHRTATTVYRKVVTASKMDTSKCESNTAHTWHTLTLGIVTRYARRSHDH